MKIRSTTLIKLSIFIIFSFYFLFSSSFVHSAKAFKFVAWGDTKSGLTALRDESNLAKPLGPVFNIYAGDLISSGSDVAKLDAWKNSLNGGSNNGTFDITFPVRGNHDSSTSSVWPGYFDLRGVANRIGATNYTELNTDTTYSFDYGNSHIVGIDVLGDVTKMSSGQMAWLDSDLSAAENRGLTHAFLFWHGPIYALAEHCCPTAPSALINVINKHPIVSATFHGHEHVVAWTHMDSSRYSNLTHEFEEFVTGDAGAGVDSCKSGRYDYCMSNELNKHGFFLIDVNNNSFTVSTYALGYSSSVKTMTFTKGKPNPTSTPGGPTNTPTPTQKPSPTPTTASGTATVSISPSSSSISSIGGTRTVNVNIGNAVKLGGFEFEVHYNPSIVKVASVGNVTLGSFLGSTGRSATLLTPIIDNTNGMVKVGAFSFGSTDGPSGSGTLASITFTATGNGTTSLNIQNILLSSSDTTPVNQPSTAYNGSITVGSGGPTNTPYPTTEPGSVPVHVQSVKGGSSSSSTVTSASISSGGNLYIASIATKPFTAASSVSGLGLAWTKAESQCAGRNQTGVEVWYAKGSTGGGSVTASFSSSAGSAIIAVSAYSNANSQNPIGNSNSANTNGTNGGCSGGSDSSSYSLTLPVSSNSLVYSSVAIRSTSNNPPSGFTERLEDYQGSGGSAAGIAVQDRSYTSATTANVSGSLGSTIDWALAAVEVRGGSGGPTGTGGDANNDGKVDGVDYMFWYNRSPNADFNGSGSVDTADYVIWLNNYDQLVPTIPPTSPTPTNFPNATNTPKPTATKVPTQGPTMTPYPTTPPGVVYRAFSNNSYWNTAMPVNAPIDPHNAEYIADSQNSGENQNYLRFTAAPGTSQGFGQPIYWAQASDPLYTISKNITVQVHIPQGAKPAGGSDGQITVYDKSTNQVIGMSGATYNSSSDSWSVGGSIDRYMLDSNGLDKRVATSNDSRNEGHRGVTTAVRAVRLDEVQAGVINHRLACFWWATGTQTVNHYWPMAGDEGAKGGIVPEGIVIRIKPSVDLTKLGLSKPALVVAKALQQYGCLVCDNSGAGNRLKLQLNEQAWTDIGLTYDALKPIPWSDWEFIKGGYDPVTGTVR